MKKIVSITLIILLIFAVFIAVKTDKIIIFDKDNVNNNIIDEEIMGNDNSNNKVKEDYTLDKLIILNPGEEGDYVQEGKTVNIHFRYKYIESGISKKKPEEIVIDFYKDGEELFNNEGDFLDDTYYVTVKYEVMSFAEKDEFRTFAPQTFLLGYCDEDKFIAKCEPRGHFFENLNSEPVRGEVSIDEGEAVLITSCFCVKEDILKKGNILVQARASGLDEAIKMPYFAINTDGVIK